MKIQELFKQSLKEDWGSSDWYPVMRAMEAYMMDGYSMEEAAKMCADRWYQDMGWEEAEQAEPNIIARFKRLQQNPPKHEPKPTDNPAYGKVNEGMYVVKSKDGVEKRFKDADSAEAKAWKEKTAKKPVVPKEKYSAEWWEYHWNKDDGFSDKLFPWTKLSRDTIDSKAIEAAVKDAGFMMKNVDDFTVGKAIDKKIGGVDCAGVIVRVSYSFTKDDDMGIDSDEPVSDAQSIYVVRDPKNPAKLIFAGYAH